MTRFDNSSFRAIPHGMARVGALGVVTILALLLTSPVASYGAQYRSGGTGATVNAQSVAATRNPNSSPSVQSARQGASYNTQRTASQSRPFLSGLFGQNTAASTEAGNVNARAGSVSQRPAAAPQPSAGRFQQGSGVMSGIMGGHDGYSHASVNAGSQPRAMSVAALEQASSSQEDAREALGKIPWDSLSNSAREKIQQIATAPTIYRRLPMAGGRCNPELFDFFLSYPNAVVELWRQMGYDEVAMSQIDARTFEITEKSGTNAKLQILYQDSELTLAYCVGAYRGSAFWRPVDGEMILLLQTRYTEDPELNPLVICRLDAFVSIKNPGADFFARTFSVAVGKIADANFTQTLAFIDSVSQNAEARPYEFRQVAASLNGLSPQARQLLAQKTMNVARQAQERRAGVLVNYQLLPKLNEPSAKFARVLSRERNGLGPSSLPNNSQYANASTPNSLSPNAFAGSDASESTAFGTRVSNYPAATSAESFAVAPSVRANSLIMDLNGSSEFALSDDEEEQWDDEELMLTGEDYLASQGHDNTPLSSVKVAPKDSLAAISAKPSTNQRALDMLESQERQPVPSYRYDSSKPLATDDSASLAIGAPAIPAMALEDDDVALTLDDDSVDSGTVASPFATSTTNATNRPAPLAMPLTSRPSDNDAQNMRAQALNAPVNSSDTSGDDVGDDELFLTLDEESSEDNVKTTPVATPWKSGMPMRAPILPPVISRIQTPVKTQNTNEEPALASEQDSTSADDNSRGANAFRLATENDATTDQSAAKNQTDAQIGSGWTRAAYAPNGKRTNSVPTSTPRVAPGFKTSAKSPNGSDEAQTRQTAKVAFLPLDDDFTQVAEKMQTRRYVPPTTTSDGEASTPIATFRSNDSTTNNAQKALPQMSPNALPKSATFAKPSDAD
ncbi:MAG: hypothetical protein Q4G03_08225 [Planctomycetia bacterium]|nr:hypothetical protein [Planctomycetia bacterium]